MAPALLGCIVKTDKERGEREDMTYDIQFVSQATIKLTKL